MGSPTQIWAARSAGTTARRPPATCVQASQPHRAISSHTPPDPELPKTTPAIGPAEGIIKGKARRPSKKLLWTVCSASGSQSGPSRLPSRNPSTDFPQANSSAFQPPCLCLCHAPCLDHRSALATESVPIPSQPCTRASSQPSPSTTPHPQGPFLSAS